MTATSWRRAVVELATTTSLRLSMGSMGAAVSSTNWHGPTKLPATLGCTTRCAMCTVRKAPDPTVVVSGSGSTETRTD